MKELKLEVGKTYRSRKGEEVKIIKNENGGEYIYKGSNSQWYTESGRFNCQSQESPYDLIEEVGSTSHTFGLVPEALTAIRYTFDIPNGMKKGTVSQEGNRIIVEIVPEEVEGPKPGDVMINDNGSVYIFKSVVNDYAHSDYAWLGKGGRLIIGGTFCHSGRPATTEEAQPIFDALKKAGKRWNPEAMKVEDLPESDQIMNFLKDYANNVTWTYQQLCWLIEAYLKHRN